MRPVSLRALPVVLAVAALFSACGGQVGNDAFDTTEDAVTARMCPNGTTVPGIDVSVYQGTIDWAKVKAAGQKFGIARISDGTAHVDSQFSRNWAGIKSAGLIRGAYQYFEPGVDPVAQANLVISKVGKLGAGDLPVMLDVESTGGQSAATIVSRIHTWVNHVTAGTGKTPWIYTGAYFWDDNVRSSDFRNLKLNIAWYGTNCPGVPNAWSGWTMHQYSSSGRVSGISGNVDMDVFNGTLAQLQAFAGETASPAPKILEGLSARFVPNADGRPELFVMGTDKAVWTTVQLGDGSWSSWVSLGGSVIAEPTGALEADGRINLFVVGTNGAAYRKAQVAKNDVFASSWTAIGDVDFESILVPARNSDGRMAVFGVGKDGALYEAHEKAANGATGWTTFVKIGGKLASSPSVVANKDGRLEAFALGADGAIWSAAQTTAGGAFGAFESLGGVVDTAPAAIRNTDGRVQLFVIGTNNIAYQKAQTTPGGSWTGWARVGDNVIVSQIGVGKNKDGRLQIFGRGNDDALWTAAQTTAGGSFGAFASLGGKVSSSPSVGTDATGRLDVYVLSGHTTYHKTQTTAGGAFGGWVSLGGTLNGF